MSRILIVDDEPAICWSLQARLADDGHVVETAGSVSAATRLLQQFTPEAVLLDVRLPGEDGLTALPRLREQSAQAPVIVMTAFGDLATAVRAVEGGAFEYLVKPFDLEQAAQIVSRALELKHLAPQPVEPVTESADVELAGSSTVMQEVFKQIAFAADAEVPVLLTGETGTGKELAARSIHQHSRRRNSPFIPVCLAALSPSVIESELFGHAKGAFTGATGDRIGLFELADGGTLFLDEIGDTPLDLQVKLLRVLEDRRLAPVGAGLMRRVDVRVIAATNCRLEELIRQGRFRLDLYHRLCVFPIEMPPLRARAGDIERLARRFAHDAKGSRNNDFSREFLDELAARSWPGNVRELRNAVEYAVVRSRGGTLLPEHLPPRGQAVLFGSDTLDETIRHWVRQQPLLGHTQDLYREFIELIERPMLHEVLKRVGGNRTAAARWLGIDRATLRTKLRDTDDSPGRDW